MERCSPSLNSSAPGDTTGFLILSVIIVLKFTGLPLSLSLLKLAPVIQSRSFQLTRSPRIGTHYLDKEPNNPISKTYECFLFSRQTGSASFCQLPTLPKPFRGQCVPFPPEWGANKKLRSMRLNRFIFERAEGGGF